MIYLSSNIIIIISKFLKVEDLINLQMINRSYFYNSIFIDLIWKYQNKTNYNNQEFKNIIRKNYYCNQNDLCPLCYDNLYSQKNIKLLCQDCTINFNTYNNLFLFHYSCFQKKNKVFSFSKIFTCSCIYCNQKVMALIN